MISSRMRELNPGSKQSPIAYHRQDAIGELVTEYNTLLGAVARSSGGARQTGTGRRMAYDGDAGGA